MGASSYALFARLGGGIYTKAAAAGAITAMFTAWMRFGKPDTSMAFNGVLAGLAAITAPCASVSPLSSIIIGAIAGVLVVLSVEFIDKVLSVRFSKVSGHLNLNGLKARKKLPTKT